MKYVISRLFVFFETKSGLLVLGFFLTTIFGSLLNTQIQNISSKKVHTFEMYKLRLSEAKDLQRELLESSNKRYFSLHQVLAMLAHPEDNTHEKIMDYWKVNVGPIKDHWNKEIFYFYAQARVLFSPALSDMLLLHEENKPIVHDPVGIEKKKRIYEQTVPKTLNGALVDAHATVYAWLFKCSGKNKCEKERLNELYELAVKQMDYLNRIQTCFAYRISAELLRYPYGPVTLLAIRTPKQCEGLVPINKQER